MTETKKYTSGEKFANVFTHLIAALLSIYGIMVLAANSKNTVQTVSTAIFGGTLIFMFLSSTLYHSMSSENTIRFFQKIDHSAIYILIAGTYTPALMLTLSFPFNLALVAIIWGLGIAGVFVYCTTVKSKRLATGLYLIMGWLSVFFIFNVWAASHLTVWLLLIGGIFYSVGCVFYLMKSRYMHFVWHLFVLAGAIMHYFAILELLKAVN